MSIPTANPALDHRWSRTRSMLKHMTPAQEAVIEYVITVFVSIVAGVVVGLIYSAVAVLIYVLSGPAQFQEEGIRVIDLAKVYIGGFSMAGAIAGLLLPLGRWAVGAALIGFLAALPAVTMIAITLWGWPFTRHTIYTIGVASLVFGPTFGLMMWRDARNGRFSPAE